MNLHKDQTSKLQAKNQQELDLLDDIRNFMKQKAAIEKHYAEGLLKLSSVYGTKKIAAVGGDATQFQNQEISKTKLRIVTILRIEGQLTFKSFAIYPLLIPLLDSKHLTHDKSKDLSRVAKCHGYDGYIRVKIRQLG